MSAGSVRLDHEPVGRHGGPTFVPQLDGQTQSLRQVAREGAARLRARPFRSIHVERQAEHETKDLALRYQLAQALGVLSELASRDRLDPAGDALTRVAGGDSEPLRAEIEADERRRRLREARERLNVGRIEDFRYGRHEAHLVRSFRLPR